MTEVLFSSKDAFHLLKQLECILECDTLIDEVGFVHPSQLEALNDETVGSHDPLDNSVPQSVNEIFSTNLLNANVLEHGHTTFWNRDHKLAISTQALFPLYSAARQAFMTAVKQHKMLINLPRDTEKNLDDKLTDIISDSEDFLESIVMKHSKALLLLSCDYGTAWNSRKIVALKKQQFSSFMDELLLSALILSYSPKSEHAWSHRRWVIKTIAGKYPNLEDIIERESELVEKIAERSKMNYHAWNHRCWLITYMTREQVLNELNKSRKWAELHVADNSCFHYRRHLLHKMIEHSCSKHDSSVYSYCMPDVYHVWKEELDWDEMLIKRYIGREALWVHRRFLSQFGINHFSTNVLGTTCHPGDYSRINYDVVNFIDGELQLLHSLRLIIPDNGFEDGRAQQVFAASYILWVLKQIPNSQMIELQQKLKDLGEIKALLKKLCPEKTLLWDGLIG